MTFTFYLPGWINSIWTSGGVVSLEALIAFRQFASLWPLVFFFAFAVWKTAWAPTCILSNSRVCKIWGYIGGSLLGSVYESKSIAQKALISAYLLLIARRLILYCWFFFLTLSLLSFSFFSAWVAFFIWALVFLLAFLRWISHWSFKVVILATSVIARSSINLIFLDVYAALRVVFWSTEIKKVVLFKQAKISVQCLSRPY